MSKSFDFFNSCFFTDFAGINFFPGIFTGCFFCNLSRIPTVPLCFYSFLRSQDFTTRRTVTSFCLSLCFTGCCYRWICYYFMSKSFDFFNSCFSTGFAGISFLPGIFTGCFFCNFSRIPTVPLFSESLFRFLRFFRNLYRFYLLYNLPCCRLPLLHFSIQH